MDYRHRISLRLRGGIFDPDLVTDILGLEPTKTIKFSEKLGASFSSKKSIWYLREPENSKPQEEFEKQWKRLYAKIDGLQQNFEDVRREFPNTHFALTIAIDAIKYIPGIVISAETLQQMAEFGITLDIDIMNYLEDEDDEAN